MLFRRLGMLAVTSRGGRYVSGVYDLIVGRGAPAS